MLAPLNVYLICPPDRRAEQLPWEKRFSLPYPLLLGWNSIDIPLSQFTPQVALKNVFQFKFDGGGGSDIFLDNIYFWRIPPVPLRRLLIPYPSRSHVCNIPFTATPQYQCCQAVII